MIAIVYIHKRKSLITRRTHDVTEGYTIDKLEELPENVDRIIVHAANPDKLHVMMPALPWVVHSWVSGQAQKSGVGSSVLDKMPTVLVQPFADQFLANVVQINSYMSMQARRNFWEDL